jgi:3-deoxy-D-manno-octulosonic-acid transferase
MPRAIYTLLLYLLLPFIPLRLLWRGIRQPDYLHHWSERFGFYWRRKCQDGKPLIWLHSVSVGETRAAEPLVRELQRRYPQHDILMTHGTPTGRATGEQLFGDSVLRAYLPYDLPGAVSRFLRHFRPQAGMLLETELWFNLIAECKRRKIPLLLVNARLSEKSARGYGRISRLTGQGLHALAGIAAQTEADAQRFQSLGERRVKVLGNLKFDVEPPSDARARGDDLRRKFGSTRPVFLAGSTRDGEEALVLDALAAADIPNLLIVIVPRHPQRFDEVAALLERRGLGFVRRSRLQADNALVPPEAAVVLGDSMGEMFAYYASCDAALIGGSLLPFGGQNLIECAIMGKPMIVGPHTYNFAAVAGQAVEQGAALRIQNADELRPAVERLLKDAALRENMGQAALKFSRSAGGTAAKIANMVQPYLFST